MKNEDVIAGKWVKAHGLIYQVMAVGGGTAHLYPWSTTRSALVADAGSTFPVEQLEEPTPEDLRAAGIPIEHAPPVAELATEAPAVEESAPVTSPEGGAPAESTK